MEALRKDGKFTFDPTLSIRRSYFDEARGERFERMLVSLSTLALMETTNLSMENIEPDLNRLAEENKVLLKHEKQLDKDWTEFEQQLFLLEREISLKEQELAYWLEPNLDQFLQRKQLELKAEIDKLTKTLVPLWDHIEKWTAEMYPQFIVIDRYLKGHSIPRISQQDLNLKIHSGLNFEKLFDTQKLQLSEMLELCRLKIEKNLFPTCDSEKLHHLQNCLKTLIEGLQTLRQMHAQLQDMVGSDRTAWNVPQLANISDNNPIYAELITDLLQNLQVEAQSPQITSDTIEVVSAISPYFDHPTSVNALDGLSRQIAAEIYDKEESDVSQDEASLCLVDEPNIDSLDLSFQNNCTTFILEDLDSSQRIIDEELTLVL